jgi:hypothetical protein
MVVLLVLFGRTRRAVSTWRTISQGRTALHTLLLGFGTVNWVTRGLFLGKRRVYLNIQVDDIFTSNSLWDIATASTANGEIFRMGEADVNALASWLGRLQRRRNAHQVTLDFAYNGAAAVPTSVDSAALAAFMRHGDRFRWISHGYSHLLVNESSVEESLLEIVRNHDAAMELALPNYDRDCMVTPDMSGLRNPRFLMAAQCAGIRYLVSDTSRPNENNPSPNVGIRNEFEPGILVIPRHPNNLFYDASTPTAWVRHYNHLYHNVWGRDLTIEEIIDREADTILRYMLAFDIDPLMFHQANLRAYDGVHSVLGDLIDRVVLRYNAVYGDVPIVSLSMHAIGEEMAQRAVYDSAEIHARLVVGIGMTIVADRDVVVPITGARVHALWESYADQVTSSVPLRANVAYSIPFTDLLFDRRGVKEEIGSK